MCPTIHLNCVKLCVFKSLSYVSLSDAGKYVQIGANLFLENSIRETRDEKYWFITIKVVYFEPQSYYKRI